MSLSTAVTFVLVVVATFNLMAACATAAPRRLVFVGDSLTGGWFATSLRDSYPDLLAARWHASILSRVGTVNAETAGLLRSVAQLPRGATDVIVEVGTNDAGHTPIADFRAAYGQLIADLRARERGAAFLCLGVWRGPESDPAAYDAVVASLCPGLLVRLAPLYMDFSNHGPVGRPTFRGPGDWFHPNDLGHRRIASAIRLPG